MGQDVNLTNQRLGGLWDEKTIPVLETKEDKYFLFSDVHLGDGTKADDFHKNEKTLETALKYYKEKNYKLLLLGDIEEFWQFDLNEVKDRYNNSIYEKIRAFGDGNVYRVFGNHDIDWRFLPDPVKEKPAKCESAVEALKMKCKDGDIRILLVHGHQGSTESDRDWWSSRFFVRVFRLVEPAAKWLGFTRHPTVAKSRVVKDYERILYSWAKKKNVILICGHSHRAIFSAKSYIERLKEDIAELDEKILANRGNKKVVSDLRREKKEKLKKIKDEKSKKRDIASLEPDGKPLPCYFNTGCALHSNGVTGIEIADDEIRLVKWHRDTQKKPPFTVLQHGKLSDYCAEVAGQ